MHLRDVGPVRILVADDHAAVRKGVCAILSLRLDVEIYGEASNGQEAKGKAHALKPDFIIVDITMPVPGYSTSEKWQFNGSHGWLRTVG
jgi:DNA-binding NarL/FixJ family response regulator